MMPFYWIDGQAGTGKSTLVPELRRRGFRAFDADRSFGYWGDPATRRRILFSSDADWLWDARRVRRTLRTDPGTPVFICGCSANSPEFAGRFARIFTLYVDTETLKHRLLSRTTNDYGKKPDQLAYELDRNDQVFRDARERGDVLVNATRSIDDVTDEILRHIHKEENAWQDR